MAGSSQPAGSVSVSVEANLDPLHRGLAQGEADTRSSSGRMCSDLSKVETQAERTGRAVEDMGAAQERAARTGRDLGQAQEGVAQSTARVATASEQAAVRWQRQAAQAEALTKTLRAAAQAQAAIDAASGGRSRDDYASRAVDIAAYAAELDRVRAKFNPLFAAGQAYKQQLVEIAQAAKVGAISEAERVAAITRTKDAFAKQVDTIRSHFGAVALNAYQWQNLGFQINDVFTSLASGISPFQTLAQQGGQIFQVLQGSSGGVVGALGAIKDRLVAIMAAAGGVIALVGLFAAAAAAANRYLTQQNEVEKSLLGTGRAAGATASQIEEIAKANAAAGQVSVATAKEVASAFAATGKIQVEAFGPGIRVIKDFAAATRQEIPAATDQLAKSLANLADGGFDQIRESTRSFDAKTTDMVRSLLRANDTLGAMRLVLQTLDRDLEGSAARVEKYGSFWSSVARTISNAATAAGEAITKGLDTTFTNDPALQLERQIRTKKFVGLDTSEQEKKLADLRRAMEETERKAAETAQRTRDNAKVSADAAVRAVLPQVTALEEIRKRAQEASSAINARESQGDTTSLEYRNQKVALEALTKARADYDFAADKGGLDAYKRAEVIKAETAALQVKTPADRAAAAADLERANQIGVVMDRTQRYQRINEASNKVLREAQQASADASRTMNAETTANNAVAAATAQRTDSVALLNAEKKVQAEIDAGAYGEGERQKKIQEELARQASLLNKQIADRIRTSRDQAAAQETANAAVAAGTLASASASRQVQNEIELRTLARERDAASGEAKVELARRYDELASAIERQLTAEGRGRVLGLSEEEDRRIELLRKEAELIGLTARERQKALAVLQAEQGLKRQGDNPTAPESVEYLDKVRLRADMETAKAEYERLAQDISSAVAGIFDDLFRSGNKSLSSFLDSFARGFSRIGTRLLEQNIIAPLLSGGLGGAAGAGGKSNSFLGIDLSDLRKTFKEGFGQGFDDTFGSWFESAKDESGNSMGFASSKAGAGLTAGLSGLAIGYSSQNPIIGAVGGGLTGLAAGAAVGGSMGPIGAVIGAGAGLIGGLLGKAEAKKAAKKKYEEQLKAMREAYQEALPQIKQLQAQLRGESLGSVGSQIDAAFQQAYQANKTASQGQDQPKADQIMRDFESFVIRIRERFMFTFEGMRSEVEKGLGTNGPFSQAAAAVVQLGEVLKGFVADSESLPQAEINAARARKAAQEGALAALDTPKELSATQRRLAEIGGTAAALGEILRALGMSADEAARAIKDRTAVAMDALRAQFSADLGAKINDAAGKSYLNDIADLVKERDALMADAKAIGSGTEKVSEYFKIASQKVINDSQLTGDAFNALVRQFPALKGAVVEFGEAIDTAAAKAEAAARATGYQDRAFAAGTDTTTLAGALAAQDRKAAQDRAAEARAGGRAMADLEKALAAERTAIIKDFAARAADAEATAREAGARRVLSAEDRLFAARNDASTLDGKLAEMERQHAQERVEEMAAGGQALSKLEQTQAAERLKVIREAGATEVAARKQALAEAQTFLDGQVKGIRIYLDGLKAGPETNLSPGARLKEAQAQFDRQLKLAKGGDRDALGSLTTYADRLLDAGKGQFASGKGYQDILGSVTKQLGALPKQVSAEQFIVDAIKTQTSTLQTAIGTGSAAEIAKALSGNFAKLDKDGSGGLSLAEFKAALGPKATTEQQVMAAWWFKQIDANGDGQITQAELQRAELKELFKANPDLIQRALNLKGTKLDINKDGLLSYKEYLAGLGPLATQDQQIMATWWFKQIDANGDGLLDKTELMRGQLLLALQTNSAQNIASAIKTNFPRLDINKDGLLSTKEFLAGLGPLATKEQQAAASWWFKQIDENGDGQLSKLELLRTTLKATIEANPALIQKALATDFGRLDANMDGKLTEAEFLAGLGPLATKEQQAAASWWYKQIDENGDGLLSKTELMRGQLLTALAANSPALISQALQTNFKNIDINKDGLLSSKEYLNSLGTLTKSEADAATKLFNKLDANNDGQISKLELIRARAEAIDGATAGTEDSATDTATAVKDGNATAKAMQSLLATQKTVLDGIQGYQKAANDNLAVARESLASLKTSSGIQDEQLRLLNKQYTLASPVRVSGSSAVLNNGMLDALNKIVFNTGMTASGLIKLMSTGKPDGLMFAFAEGGWVRGPGSGTSDSIGARLSNGEFVVNAAAARLNAPMLEAMNDNRSLMMPALAMPVPAMGGSMDVGALIAAIRSLEARMDRSDDRRKAEAEMVARNVKASGDRQVRATEDVADEVAGSRDDARRDAAPKRAGRGEPVRSAA